MRFEFNGVDLSGFVVSGDFTPDPEFVASRLALVAALEGTTLTLTGTWEPASWDQVSELFEPVIIEVIETHRDHALFVGGGESAPAIQCRDCGMEWQLTREGA